MRYLFFIPLTIIFASCGAPSVAFAQRGGVPALTRPSPTDLNKIGKRVWKNECDGTVEGLTSWEKFENFPSLGIGHFIWFPKNAKSPFDESFPQLIAYMKSQGVKRFPAVAMKRHCPWKSSSEFNRKRNSPEMVSLRNFLYQTTDLQADFLFYRLSQALPKMKQFSGGAKAAKIEANFYRVASTPEGMFALIDYVNFKGEGTKKDEQYKGQGWGLLWVLSEMRETRGGPASVIEFSEAAKRALNRRIQNAPRKESQWRAGWSNRCDSYKQRF